jgi:molybdate transport repressor ModE-like protein
MLIETNYRTAGVIAAGKKKIRNQQAHSLLQIGSISAIKRIVLTFQVAGIEPIVIITGYDADYIERELWDYGAIFLHKENYEQSQLFHLAQMGLEFVQDKCDKVMFTPVDIPLFSPDTLKKMMDCPDEVVSPSYQDKGGHPILIASRLIPDILAYDGDMGMRGALKKLGIQKKRIKVDDEGILKDIDSLEHTSELIKRHTKNIFHPYLKVSLETENLFFDARTKLLLTLIQETNSVKGACKCMGLSYSKAWKMLNSLEKALQFQVLTRQQGGSHGGKTYLTPEGEELLKDYELFEKKLKLYAVKEFKNIFIDKKQV